MDLVFEWIFMLFGLFVCLFVCLLILAAVDLTSLVAVTKVRRVQGHKTEAQIEFGIVEIHVISYL